MLNGERRRLPGISETILCNTEHTAARPGHVRGPTANLSLLQVTQVGEVLRALGTNPTEGEVKKLVQSCGSVGAM